MPHALCSPKGEGGPRYRGCVGEHVIFEFCALWVVSGEGKYVFVISNARRSQPYS